MHFKTTIEEAPIKPALAGDELEPFTGGLIIDCTGGD